jgi:nicotinamide-nucleotide amidase
MMPIDQGSFYRLAVQLNELLLGQQATLATAESCTGGWVSQAITAVPGSALVFDCGFVTYSNAAKQRLLGVGAQTLANYGAVSIETAVEMAEGALKNSLASVSLSITGIAGPTGGTPEKPVGLVCFAWAVQGKATVWDRQIFEGDREAIREQAVVYAIAELIKISS